MRQSASAPPPIAPRSAGAPALDIPRLPTALRLLNRVGRLIGSAEATFDPEALQARARARAELPQAVLTPRVAEGLRVLCTALQQDVDLTPLGRFLIAAQTVDLITNRFRLDDVLLRRPELATTAVPAPVFVAGIQRSGTTFLHRLLALDPEHRTLPLWEVSRPFPVGDPLAPVPAGGDDQRLAQSQREMAITRRILPELDDLHPMAAEEPEEDNLLLAAAHSSHMYQVMLPLPTYRHWFQQADHVEGYQTFRHFLQYLQWRRPTGSYWLSKSPGHLQMLKPLFSTFPDAVVVQTHRDPATVVVSFANLLARSARIHLQRPDPHAFGALSATVTEHFLRTGLRDRELVADRIVDVHFADLVADPLTQVRRVYDRIGRPLSQVAERRMLDYCQAERSRPRRHGYHAADFNLAPATLRKQFAFYTEYFDIRTE